MLDMLNFLVGEVSMKMNQLSSESICPNRVYELLRGRIGLMKSGLLSIKKEREREI